MASKRQSVRCECRPVVDARYDGSDGSPTAAVLEALSRATRVDIVELPALYEFVDPDALDDLFASRNGGTGGDILLRFTVEDWNVFVRDDGRIRVCDASQRTESKPVFEATEA